MTNPEVALLMLGLFIVLVLLGFPIAFTLLAMGVAFGYYAYHQGNIETFSDIFNNNIFYLVNQNTYSVMENPTLVAIPLFLFMGYIVERANIIDKRCQRVYLLPNLRNLRRVICRWSWPFKRIGKLGDCLWLAVGLGCRGRSKKSATHASCKAREQGDKYDNKWGFHCPIVG